MHGRRRSGWGAIVSAQPYDEAKAFNLTPASAARRLKNLQNQAQALNMKLIPASPLTPRNVNPFIQEPFVRLRQDAASYR